VILTWADKVYPARTTYNVYRGVGMCSGTPTFSKLASGLTAKTYQDTTVIPGDYCYAVTVQLNGIESRTEPHSRSSCAAAVTRYLG